MERSRVVEHDGVRRVVKPARTADERHLVTREAELLQAARHPGVVELLGVEEAEDGVPSLVTRHVDGPTLAEVSAIPMAEVGGVVAGVATTLADLHDLGVVHGAVAPEHVILAGGRPVLCGFGHGARTGQAPIPPTAGVEGFADPAREPGGPLLASADVFALGALMRWMIGRADVGRHTGRSALLMRTLAARATAAEPSRRPTARELASAVNDAVPGGRLPPPRTANHQLVTLRGAGGSSSVTGSGVVGRRISPGRTRGVIAGVVGVALTVGVGVVGLHLANRPGMAPGSPPPATVSAPATSGPGPTTPALTTPPPPTDPPEPLGYADGILTAGSARWAVGQPGDRVAAGDWTCSGASTLALLRPATGEVFVFAGWATAGRDVAADLASRVPGGFALRRADLDRNGCPELMVDRTDGPPVPIPLTTNP